MRPGEFTCIYTSRNLRGNVRRLYMAPLYSFKLAHYTLFSLSLSHSLSPPSKFMSSDIHTMFMRYKCATCTPRARAAVAKTHMWKCGIYSRAKATSMRILSTHKNKINNAKYFVRIIFKASATSAFALYLLLTSNFRYFILINKKNKMEFQFYTYNCQYKSELKYIAAIEWRDVKRRAL